MWFLAYQCMLQQDVRGALLLHKESSCARFLGDSGQLRVAQACPVKAAVCEAGLVWPAGMGKMTECGAG